MAISFAPLKRLLEMRDIGISRLKHARVIGGKTYDTIAAAMETPVDKGATLATINALCAYLDVQPGDIMEYVPDQQTEEEQ